MLQVKILKVLYFPAVSLLYWLISYVFVRCVISHFRLLTQINFETLIVQTWAWTEPLWLTRSGSPRLSLSGSFQSERLWSYGWESTSVTLQISFNGTSGCCCIETMPCQSNAFLIGSLIFTDSQSCCLWAAKWARVNSALSPSLQLFVTDVMTGWMWFVVIFWAEWQPTTRLLVERILKLDKNVISW